MNYNIIIISSLSLIFILIFVKYQEEYEYDFKICLVSLDKDIKRRDNILKNITPDYIYSVDGKKLDKEKLKKDNIITDKTKLKNGEIGCFLSHIYFLNKCLEINKLILVIEDDIDIFDYKLIEIQNIIKEAPKDFEILFIGHNYYEKENYSKDYIEDYDYNKIKLVYGTHCYVINNKLLTLEKINNFYPFSKPIDVTFPKVFKCYNVTPKIIFLNSEAKYSNTQN